MFRKLTIATRSFVSFGLILLAIVFIGIFSILQLSKLNDITDILTLHRMPALHTATELRENVLQISGVLNELSDARDIEDLNRFKSEIETYQSDFDGSVQRMRGLVKSDEAAEALKQVIQKSNTFFSSLPQLYRLSENFSSKNEAINYRKNTVVPNVESLIREVGELTDYQVKKANEVNDEATDTYESALLLISLAIVLLLIFVIFIALGYSRSILQPMREAVYIAQRVAQGDLTMKIEDEHSDESAKMIHALSDMQANLKETISLIMNSSQQLAATSEELSVVTGQSSQVVHNQSAQLEQAATAVNELTSAIEEVSRNAQSTSKDTENADRKVQQGRAKIIDTVETVKTLAEDIERSSESVKDLASNIKSISSVLNVIREIADQTNLLALNAAIEAARAGDAGRGFAVVADEVRALAHRTQTSTVEIEQVISEVESGSENAVKSMSESNAKADETGKTATDAGDAFQEITNLMSQINEQNVMIATAAEEQATVSKEVDANLVAVRDLSSQVSTGAEHTKASSVELAKLAETLNELVHKFKL